MLPALGLGMVLTVAWTLAARAESAPEGAEAAVKGAFGDAEGVAEGGAPGPGTTADAARKRYSPWVRPYPTHVYFGDTHIHTANSGDAFMAGDRLDPEQAYRFARGEEVVSSSGVAAKLSRPLDFAVISDHAGCLP